ncbi:MAG: 3-isopropylmalate dehydratase small subunit [Candidatus Thorarchaeota archaeon]
MSFSDNIEGKAILFGDDINTDQIIQGRYLQLLDYEEMAKHTFEVIRPDFVNNVEEGDVIVGGRNFGSGSSREEAPMVLQTVGIRCVIAESFARIFYRNAFNIGIPALVVKDVTKHLNDGDRIRVDLQSGTVINLATGDTLSGGRIPVKMLEILRAGGAVPWYKAQKSM